MHFLHQVAKTAQGHSTTTNPEIEMNSTIFTPSQKPFQKPKKTQRCNDDKFIIILEKRGKIQ
jgi:hypothetical protein